MLFAVASTAWREGSEALLDCLDGILRRVEDGVHELDLVEADLLEESSWFRTSRPGRQKVLQQIAQDALYRTPRSRGPHLKRVSIEDEPTAARAGRLALVPLRVLCENEHSDGALVQVALQLLASPATLELCFPPGKIEPPAFRIESRGGHGEMRKLILACKDEADSDARPARLVVVTDSDGEWAGDVKDHAQRIRTLCDSNNLLCPPLNKRTAENYIPDGFWRDWASSPEHASHRPAVEALLRLSSSQRDHVDMEAPGKWDSKKPEVAALFLDVSPADRELLGRVNFKGKGEKMLIVEMKNHLSALTPQDLRDRDPGDDLARLVRCIEDEL